MNESKPFDICKHVVMDAFKRVKANRGNAGVDNQDLEQFEQDLKKNLYKIWNRMSSGSYFPPPVKLVEISKKSRVTRALGIPTVGDRVAQMVVKMYIEPKIDPIFHEDSYGYRPGKSAIDAIGKARKRCWRFDYVIEFDIKGLFDNIDHELLMRAVRMHVKESWAVLYIERWLKAPFADMTGRETKRVSGTPQGGVISPVMANLFMHYAFDRWMYWEYPESPFERYTDDAIIHCRTEAQAVLILKKPEQRLKECKLELHPMKTKIVYCQDKDRKRDFSMTEFDFLGYTFRKVFIKDMSNRLYFNFLPLVSKKAAKAFRTRIKAMELHKYSGSTIDMIAEMINPTVRGWLNYFTKFNASAVRYTIDCLNRGLVKWAMCKYKHFRGHRKRASSWLREVAKREPRLFAH